MAEMVPDLFASLFGSFSPRARFWDLLALLNQELKGKQITKFVFPYLAQFDWLARQLAPTNPSITLYFDKELLTSVTTPQFVWGTIERRPHCRQITVNARWFGCSFWSEGLNYHLFVPQLLWDQEQQRLPIALDTKIIPTRIPEGFYCDLDTFNVFAPFFNIGGFYSINFNFFSYLDDIKTLLLADWKVVIRNPSGSKGPSGYIWDKKAVTMIDEIFRHLAAEDPIAFTFVTDWSNMLYLLLSNKEPLVFVWGFNIFFPGVWDCHRTTLNLPLTEILYRREVIAQGDKPMIYDSLPCYSDYCLGCEDFFP